jgi:hypothetical protein
MVIVGGLVWLAMDFSQFYRESTQNAYVVEIVKSDGTVLSCRDWRSNEHRD